MMSLKEHDALVLFSGGQDSTTCLFWAIKHFNSVRALCFDYGQRHKNELESARYIADIAGVKIDCLRISLFEQLGGNALTGDEALDAPQDSSLPNTFVPGRNLIMLSAAAAFAYQRDIKHIVTGVCETDYSGYPDCRDNTIKALQATLNLGMEANFCLHTPLMFLSKAETVKLAREIGALNALAYSHTCYAGEFPPCQKCAACELRAKGFEQAGVKDPLLVRAGTLVA